MSTNATRWRPGALTWLITVIAFGGLVAGLYPMAAAWLSSYNQSQILKRAATNLDDIDPTPADQLGLANQYNDALTAGVKLEAGGNVPVGTGNLTDSELRYSDMLRAGPEGLIGRVKIDSIDVDLPIYHGTSEETLLRGAGHLEGSHLPVGGESTRSVVTAHRGLANSTMFTNLNQVRVNDTFTLEVLGEALVYEVFDIQVIDPNDTSSLAVIPGKDTATLITCTPLGINSHRIVVTGERITPTPINAIEEVGSTPSIPGFPWWAVLGSGGILLISGYVWRRGYVDTAVAQSNGSPGSHASVLRPSRPIGK